MNVFSFDAIPVVGHIPTSHTSLSYEGPRRLNKPPCGGLTQGGYETSLHRPYPSIHSLIQATSFFNITSFWNDSEMLQNI